MSAHKYSLICRYLVGISCWCSVLAYIALAQIESDSSYSVFFFEAIYTCTMIKAVTVTTNGCPSLCASVRYQIFIFLYVSEMPQIPNSTSKGDRHNGRNHVWHAFSDFFAFKHKVTISGMTKSML